MSSGLPNRDALPEVDPATGVTLLPPETPARGLGAASTPASASELLRNASVTPIALPAAPPRTAAFPVRPAPLPRPTWLRSLARTVRRGLLASAKLALVGVLTYGLMFNFSVVRGSSMSPSIHDGDRILVDHLTFLLQGVRRGDIVVLQYPLDPSVDYIKRVIGLPGDSVLIENGCVYVNGEQIDEPYVDSPGTSRHAVRVLPDHYFVLGDNRPHSSDSREFGQVHKDLLRGRVDVRVWPFDRAGRID